MATFLVVNAGMLDAHAAMSAVQRICPDTRRFLVVPENHTRNAHYLQTAHPSDALPSDKADLERLALLLGYVHRPHSVLRDDYRRVTRRARRVVERVFYGGGT